jgi:hypothetical protein
MLVDGLTAANDLGLTTAVPSRVIVHTDLRRRTISLGNLTIEFKRTAPSKLYWAGRPAMRVVQALHWLKDLLATDPDEVLSRMAAILADPVHGAAIREDLRLGLWTLPTWMQHIVRRLTQDEGHAASDACPAKYVARNPSSRRRGDGARGHGARVSRFTGSGKQR